MIGRVCHAWDGLERSDWYVEETGAAAVIDHPSYAKNTCTILYVIYSASYFPWNGTLSQLVLNIKTNASAFIG